MAITASKLRENINSVLDEAVETGTPVEILRKGRLLRIVPDKRISKLSRLKKCDTIIGDPEGLVHMNWIDPWTEHN